ncbi:MAG: tetratricopeptide repeat protein [Pseudomonadota bacterium]
MKFALILVGALCSSVALADSMQVIGGNSYATECFASSNAASLTGSASARDIQSCDRAISHGGLRKRDLMATYVNRGIIFAALNNYDKAQADYERAMKMSRNVAEAYINRGNLWFMRKDFKQAIKDYDKSLKLKVKKPYVALLNKGMANETLGNLHAARRNYKEAMKYVKEWPLAQAKLDRVNRKIKYRKSRNENKGDS